VILGGAGYSVFKGVDLWRPKPSILGANDRLRVGIVGLGNRGGRHLHEYLKLPNVEVAAICDTDETVLRAVAEHLSRASLPRPQIMTDYRQLLDSLDVDVLSVATPKKIRTDIGVEACRAGKHLLIEKPFSTSFEKGQELVEAAKKNNTLVQQRESLAFAPAEEVSSMSPFNNDEIRSVKGWKRVRIQTPSGQFPQSLHNEISYDKLLEYVLDELDVARSILGAEVPTRVVSAVFNNGTKFLPTSLMLQFDFDQNPDSKRSLSFELKTYESGIFGSQYAANSGENYIGDKSKLFVNTEQFESRCVFYTSESKFTVDCNSDFERLGVENNSWSNFVSSVRDGNSESLQNPIHEAVKSCRLIHLAEMSLKSNQILELGHDNYL
jgi:hypothetical protein